MARCPPPISRPAAAPIVAGWWRGRCSTVTAVSSCKARRLPASVFRKPRGGVLRGWTGGPDGSGGEGGADVPALRLGPERTESAPDGDWVVRPVPGAASTKAYRCPGCDQE